MKKFILKNLIPLCIILSGMIAGVVFEGCTSDDDILSIDDNKESTSNPFKRSEADAIDIAIDNIDLIGHVTPKSRSAVDIIANVSVIGSKLKSRSGAAYDSLIYVVNFKDNGGFALIPISKKADPILAMCESGNYSANCSIDNPGFSLYMDMAMDALSGIDTASNDSLGLGPVTPWDPDPNKHPWQIKETEEVISTVTTGPRVSVEWDQTYIYGALAPNELAGCSPIAIAQTMTYFNYPTYMRFTFSGKTLDYLNINWEEIKQHQKMSTRQYHCTCSEENHTRISHIIRQIGEEAGSRYNTDGTSTYTYQTRQYLLNKGFYVSSLRNYETGDSKKIGEGIILIRGDKMVADSTLIGHIWVLDGIREETIQHTYYRRQNDNMPWEVISRATYKQNLNHFNWGWGGNPLSNCNGWFNDGVFNAAKKFGNSNRDFKYNVQYLIVNH